MAKITRRESRIPFPDLFDWRDSPWASALGPFGPAQAFRVEDYYQDNRYVVRAELPGLEPDKDIQVTVEGGVLTIRAERQEEHKEGHRSEFRYGALSRSVKLPDGAVADQVTASYDKGILEVSVPVQEATAASRRVEISKAG
jgi:HSP20 family protein